MKLNFKKTEKKTFCFDAFLVPFVLCLSFFIVFSSSTHNSDVEKKNSSNLNCS